jgi:hypothetical protein
MRKITLKSITIPLAFLIVTAISYGTMIFSLGFYWDDWPYIWYYHLLGPLGYTSVFASDRPFLSLIYILTSPIMGESTLAWHVFGVLTRWLTVVAFWWALKKVWPKYSRQITWAAFIYAAFPGFGQHWISVIYSRAYLILAAFLFSFGCMAKAITDSTGNEKKQYIGLTALGVFLSIFNLLSTEYFFGLELLRPLLIWYCLDALDLPFWKKAQTALKHWAPYFVTLLFYTVWRAFFFQSANYNVEIFDEISNGTGNTLVQMAQAAYNNLVNSMLVVWQNTLQIFFQPPNASSTWFAIGAFAAAASLMVFYFLWVERKYLPIPVEPPEDQWARQAIFAGLAFIIVGGLPFQIANLKIETVFPWDRFMLALMFGASLILVGLLEYFIKTQTRRAVLLALLIGLAAGLQTQNAISFRRDWSNFQNFFWQLSWRVPTLQPNTIVFTHELPLKYYTDNSLTAPLNWIYQPELKQGQDMPYILIYTRTRLNSSLKTLDPHTAVKFSYRAFKFKGNTSDSITIFHPTPGCVRVMDPIYENEKSYPELPALVSKSIPLSDLTRIQDSTQPVQPPEVYFGQEPEHTWCYYFEKAELARQTGDWQKVAELGNQADSQHYKPNLPSEIFPFVEAYARTNDPERAQKWTLWAYNSDQRLRPGLCAIWQRLSAEKLTEPTGAEISSKLRCSQLEKTKDAAAQ